MAVPRSLPLLLMLLGLAACGSRLSSADLERQQDCRAQADGQFDRQNRYLMSERSQTDTPFSSSGMPGDPSRGLGDVFRRDRMVDDCLHSTDTAPVATAPGRRS
ncbi:MAG: hypothetical protein INR65_16640 [Gluconacetobacter diazotrophicus]|nr:hypothetical protein [Gluconacetobacter diazotrophicus]